ncbi:hypothetical protein TNCV_2258371 [Trichonephila clavipes]|nr:hypothetical protein TNCV_2258371 [Trichonephila clavipes]
MPKLNNRSDWRMVTSYYTRAFGDGPQFLNHGQVTWTTPELAPPSPNYHTTNGRTFQLSTDLTCIAALHGGSLVVLRDLLNADWPGTFTRWSLADSVEFIFKGDPQKNNTFPKTYLRIRYGMKIKKRAV